MKKTTLRVIIALAVVVAALIYFRPQIMSAMGSGGTPTTFSIGTPTSYDVQSNISCTTISPCTDYLTSNAAPSTITAKCTDGKCVFTTPSNPDAVSGGGLQ